MVRSRRTEVSTTTLELFIAASPESLALECEY